MRRAMGVLPVQQLDNGPRSLTELPNEYDLQQRGIPSLGSLPVTQATSYITTNQGDYVRAKVAAGNERDGIHYTDVILVDVAGKGNGSLHYTDKPANLYGNQGEHPNLFAPAYQPENPQDANAVLPAPSIFINPSQGMLTLTATNNPVDGGSNTKITYDTGSGSIEVTPS